MVATERFHSRIGAPDVRSSINQIPTRVHAVGSEGRNKKKTFVSIEENRMGHGRSCGRARHSAGGLTNGN